MDDDDVNDDGGNDETFDGSLGIGLKSLRGHFWGWRNFFHSEYIDLQVSGLDKKIDHGIKNKALFSGPFISMFGSG